MGAANSQNQSATGIQLCIAMDAELSERSVRSSMTDLTPGSVMAYEAQKSMRSARSPQSASGEASSKALSKVDVEKEESVVRRHSSIVGRSRSRGSSGSTMEARMSENALPPKSAPRTPMLPSAAIPASAQTASSVKNPDTAEDASPQASPMKKTATLRLPAGAIASKRAMTRSSSVNSAKAARRCDDEGSDGGSVSRSASHCEGMRALASQTPRSCLARSGRSRRNVTLTFGDAQLRLFHVDAMNVRAIDTDESCVDAMNVRAIDTDCESCVE